MTSLMRPKVEAPFFSTVHFKDAVFVFIYFSVCLEFYVLLLLYYSTTYMPGIVAAVFRVYLFQPWFLSVAVTAAPT